MSAPSTAFPEEEFIQDDEGVGSGGWGNLDLSASLPGSEFGNQLYGPPGGAAPPPIPNFLSDHSSSGELRIYNVLALAVLECDRKFELDEAIKHFVNASYTPEQFPALRVEVRGPLTQTLYTISLFDGGRIQSTGGCMPKEAGVCMKQVARRIRQKLDIDIKFKNFEIHNLLGVVDLACDISLAKLYSLAPGQKDFEPTKFPALRISIPVPQSVPAAAAQSEGPAGAAAAHSRFKGANTRKREAARIAQQEKKRKVETITASIFANGKINFIGGKSVRSIVAVLNELRPFIEACT